MRVLWFGFSSQGLRQLTSAQAEVLLMAAASLADTHSVLAGDLPASMTYVPHPNPYPIPNPSPNPNQATLP